MVIASPPAEHLWQAELASRAGDPGAGREAAGAHRARGRRGSPRSTPPPWVGFNRRFQHGAGLLAAIPAEGPLELELELRYRRDSWRPVSVDDDALADLAPHLVDLALVLSGSGRRGCARRACRRSAAELELETARGPAPIRCATDRAHRELVAVRGTGGRVVGRSRAGGPLAAIAGRLPGRAHPLVASLRASSSAFASCGARRRPRACWRRRRDGARVMELIDDARRLGGERRAA